jgi:hypothetical protein
MRPAGGDSAAGRKRVVGMERPEEPRLRIVRPIRESVESFGFRGPSGQDRM